MENHGCVTENLLDQVYSETVYTPNTHMHHPSWHSASPSTSMLLLPLQVYQPAPPPSPTYTQVSHDEENPLKINSKEQWNSEEILLTFHASKQGHSKIFPGGVPKST